MVLRDFKWQIDWEESANEGRICVRPLVDGELDGLQKLYAGLDIVLVSCNALGQPLYMSHQRYHQNRVAQDAVATASPEYKSLNIVYFPQLGGQS
jgi:DNA mismatch repair protein MSH5